MPLYFPRLSGKCANAHAHANANLPLPSPSKALLLRGYVGSAWAGIVSLWGKPWVMTEARSGTGAVLRENLGKRITAPPGPDVRTSSYAHSRLEG